MATWSIDPDHTVAAFSVGHMMISLVHGQFNQVAGKIRFSPPDLTSLAAEITIESAGVITGIAKRDEHLRSADFLDVANFPLIEFKSAGVSLTGINTCLVNGLLTIRGTTRPVELETQYFGPVRSPDGETSLGFRAGCRVNRESFGLIWNLDMENHGFMVGKELRLALEVEADLVE